MPLFSEIDNDPTFVQAIRAAGGAGVDLGGGVTANYSPIDSASNGGINPGGTNAGSILPNGGVVANPNPASAHITDAAAAPTYANIAGFDPAKIQAGVQDGKYSPAFYDFSGFVGGGGNVSRGNLGDAISYAQQHGFPNAQAVGDDKIDYGDGRGPIDVITSNGSLWFANEPSPGDAGASGGPTAAGSAAPSGGGGGSAAGAPRSVLTTQQFAPFTYQNFTAPAPYQLPTLAEAENQPGYQFALGQGEQAIQNSAAARGVLNTGGSLKSLNDYAQNFAQQDYQNVVNQGLQAYQTNFNNAYQTNQANNAGNLGAFTANTNAALGYGNLANAETSTANQYALGEGALANQATATANQYALGIGSLGLQGQSIANANALNWANYGLNANQQQFYQNYAFPVGVGLDATGQLNGAAGQYGQTGSNLITGAGNAAAAGTVGSANAWNQAAGGIANMAQGLAYLYPYYQNYQNQGGF